MRMRIAATGAPIRALLRTLANRAKGSLTSPDAHALATLVVQFVLVGAVVVYFAWVFGTAWSVFRAAAALT